MQEARELLRIDGPLEERSSQAGGWGKPIRSKRIPLSDRLSPKTTSVDVRCDMTTPGVETTKAISSSWLPKATGWVQIQLASLFAYANALQILLTED